MIGIVDFGMGNIGSIANMITHLQGDYSIVENGDDLLSCSKIILPGVGAFDSAIQQLHQRNLWSPLQAFALEEQRPVLGLCLGMQIMCKSSEEGKLPGLGWFNTTVRKFYFAPGEDGSKLRVPHMGWNTVEPLDSSFPLFKNLDGEMRFYFVHSYAVHEVNADFVKGCTTYGYPFASVMGSGNIMGFQCHPEKSHRFGMQVFKNFMEL